MLERNIMRITRIITIFLLTLPGTSCAVKTKGQENAAESTKIKYEVCYDIRPRRKWYETLFEKVTPFETILTVNLPKTMPGRQEIHEIKFDPEPDRLFSVNGNDYTHFRISVNKKKVRVKINVKATLLKYDLASAMNQEQITVEKEPNLTAFLRPERMIESDDPLIQKLAKDITGTTRLDIVRGIYDFVIYYLDVDVSKLKGVGAAKTAQDKKGMCIDYCDLFAALCRAKQIPARVVAGYRTNFSVSPKHSWVEVYFKDYGWVPFDPSQWKPLSQVYLEDTFYNLEPQLLCFTKIRNDAVLQNNYFYTISKFDEETFSRIYPPVETIKFTKPLRKKYDSRKDAERQER